MQWNSLISVKLNTGGSVLPHIHSAIYNKYFTSLSFAALSSTLVVLNWEEPSLQ